MQEDGDGFLLGRFELFLVFTEYFKTIYLTLISKAIFFFLSYVHHKHLKSIWCFVN